MSVPITRQLSVSCGVQLAFKSFVDGIDAWWPASHRRLRGSRLVFEANVGGRIFESNDQGEQWVLGEVLDYQAPCSLAYTWHPGQLTQPTTVEVTFEERDQQTMVTVVHSEGKAAMGELWAERAKTFAANWDQVLSSYARYCVQTN